MEKPEWTPVEAFGEDQDSIRIYTTEAAANSEYAEQLLLDPLPLLVQNIPGVKEDWSVSVERVNGQEAIGRLKPPRKALVTWTVIPALSQVHGVL
ncbi:MAG TPA: hypothetical protein VNO56_09795, partial [Gaiellaceae bacterium]|nr:hypothetical protein [Gaiellaceae bacterium]